MMYRDAQIKKMSNDTLGRLYEALFEQLAMFGELEAVYGWQKPQACIELETLFLQVEAELVERAATIAPPELMAAGG